MNKYQLAIKKLKESKIKLQVYKVQEENDIAPTIFDFYHSEIFTLEELAELATPKEGVCEYDNFGDDAHLSCPNCKQPIVNVWSKLAYMPNCCHCCGQALDWSDEDGRD